MPTLSFGSLAVELRPRGGFGEELAWCSEVADIARTPVGAVHAAMVSLAFLAVAPPWGPRGKGESMSDLGERIGTFLSEYVSPADAYIAANRVYDEITRRVYGPRQAAVDELAGNSAAPEVGAFSGASSLPTAGPETLSPGSV